MWSLNTGGLLIEVVFRSGLTELLYTDRAAKANRFAENRIKKI